MQRTWDGGDVALRSATWRLAHDVLRPGAHLLAFGGSRTFHRMACAIEDAGFEIRDCIMWMYGTGFPKSHDVSKGIDKALGAERGVIGQHRTNKADSGGQTYAALGEFRQSAFVDITAPATPEAADWQGWGTALKPAFEPIIVARKPLGGTVAANVLAHGTGALNIDACRIPSSTADLEEMAGRSGSRVMGGTLDYGMKPQGMWAPDTAGRWPANVIHDGSDEVLEAFAAYGERPARDGFTKGSNRGSGSVGFTLTTGESAQRRDTGTAARFFYSAKATAADRADSKHPTVKPLALMRYLVTLVTPPGGTVLDPFSGSGTTLQAAAECGFNAVGIERDPEYQADILRRIARLQAAELEALCA